MRNRQEKRIIFEKSSPCASRRACMAFSRTYVFEPNHDLANIEKKSEKRSASHSSVIFDVFIAERTLQTLHRFVRSQAQAVVQSGGAAVSFLTALPEQAFVVSEERSAFHLRLMFQDGVPFGPQFFRLMGTTISMCSISHSAHAPRYIQMRQSFSHLAPSSFSRSMAASTASVQTRCVPCGSAKSPATKIW